MKIQNASRVFFPLASVGVGIVIGLLVSQSHATRNAATKLSHNLENVKRSVLRECQAHEYSSLSEPHAPDMVEVRKFIDFQLCDPEEVAIILRNLDVDEVRLIFGCLKDMTSAAQ